MHVTVHELAAAAGLHPGSIIRAMKNKIITPIPKQDDDGQPYRFVKGEALAALQEGGVKPRAKRTAIVNVEESQKSEDADELESEAFDDLSIQHNPMKRKYTRKTAKPQKSEPIPISTIIETAFRKSKSAFKRQISSAIAAAQEQSDSETELALFRVNHSIGTFFDALKEQLMS